MANEHLTKKVTDWIEGQGYPLEMRTAVAFRRERFAVVQAEYYEDPVSKQQREIDVVASAQEEVIKNTILRLSIVVECKVSRDKPWVFFTARSRIHPKASIAQRTGSAIGSLFLDRICGDADAQALPLFMLPQRTAYAVTQAFTTGKDIPYEACMTAASAALANAREVDVGRRRSLWKYARIAMPVVVVDGRFFDASLDSADALNVEEVTDAVLAWRNPIGSVGHTFIHLITTAALDKFVQAATVTAKGIFTKTQALAEAQSRARR